MRIIGTYYGRCDAIDWRKAENLAGEILEYMDFVNIRRLSEVDHIFPFDYIATRNHKNYLIDVTLRTRKPVRTKRLNAWRTLSYETTLLIILPEKLMSVLIAIEPTDQWVGLTPTVIKNLEKVLETLSKA